MNKPEEALTMKEFMESKLGYVTWNPRKIEKMAQEEYTDGKDLIIHCDEVVFRITHDSIGDYFTGASSTLPTPLVIKPTEVVIADVVDEPNVVLAKKVGRPKKDANV